MRLNEAKHLIIYCLNWIEMRRMNRASKRLLMRST